MKKILFLAFVLVVAVGMTAAAGSHGIEFSTSVDVEAAQGVGDDDGVQANHYSVGFDVSVYVDEFSRLYFESEIDEVTGPVSLSVEEAALITDLGGWIGDFTGAPLPFGLHYKAGFAEWDYEDVADVSDYGNEGLAVADFTAVGQRFGLTFVDMVNVYAAHSFSQLEGVNLDDLEDIAEERDKVLMPQMIFGADAGIPIEGIGTLSLEAVFSQFDLGAPGNFGEAVIQTDQSAVIGENLGQEQVDGVTIAARHLGFGASFAMDEIIPDLSGALGGSFTLDLTDYDHDDWVDVDGNDSPEDFIPQWYWGWGGSVSYLDGLVGASFSLSGTEEYEWVVGDDETTSVNELGLGLALTSSPLPGLLTFEAGLGLGLDDDYYEEIMNSADVSMTFSPGAASFTLGYFWIEEDALNAVGDLNAFADSLTHIYFAAGLEY